jgi:hypothetical protein
VPTRLADAWVQQDPAWQRPVNEAGDKSLQQLAQRLSAWELVPTGTEGYRKAEVTAGGVDTRELSSQTLEATRQPGLYFIGEAVDVTGWLGGYNFQWAWASAHACAQALAGTLTRLGSPRPGSRTSSPGCRLSTCGYNDGLCWQTPTGPDRTTGGDPRWMSSIFIRHTAYSGSHDDHSCQGKRAVRRGPAPLQAHHRESWAC